MEQRFQVLTTSCTSSQIQQWFSVLLTENARKRACCSVRPTSLSYTSRIWSTVPPTNAH